MILKLNLRLRHKILQNTFNRWKQYIIEKRIYNSKIIEAKKYYSENLIRENLRLIIEAALEKREELLVNYLKNEKRRLILAQRYFKIWKSKSKHCTSRKRRTKVYDEKFKNTRTDNKPLGIGQKENPLIYSLITSFPDVFNWDPNCFATPRIPDYMKN
ncbi:hypothetical protein HHI36_007175 [Cryptolaemus montrouzieri]|uniref:Uncharacterized protein n=1 Tax=Cryptolaemus montrouzieri TaxID=559131 RepID=A0ABD2MNS1_9CUCU